jgi:hypothetical protein
VISDVAPLWWRRDIRLGNYGSDVDVLRRRLGLSPGPYDAVCEAIVRGLGKRVGHDNSGVLDSHTAALVGESEANRAGVLPQWYINRDDARLLRVLDTDEADLFDAIRRWQGNHGHQPTGVISPDQALQLGE